MSVTNRFRPGVEAFEDRITPTSSGHAGDSNVVSLGGVLAVAPPAAGAPEQSIQINQQVSHIILPDGDVLPGHGLKTAEAHTPVVDWTPT